MFSYLKIVPILEQSLLRIPVKSCFCHMNYEKQYDMIHVVLVSLLLTLKQISHSYGIYFVDFELANADCKINNLFKYQFFNVFLVELEMTFIHLGFWYLLR